MRDAYFMSGFQRLTNALRNIQSLVDGNGPALDALGQRFAFHQFENKEARAVVFLDSVDGSNVWMVE